MQGWRWRLFGPFLFWAYWPVLGCFGLGSTLVYTEFLPNLYLAVMNINGYFQAWFSLSLLYQGKSLKYLQEIDI